MELCRRPIRKKARESRKRKPRRDEGDTSSSEEEERQHKKTKGKGSGKRVAKTENSMQKKEADCSDDSSTDKHSSKMSEDESVPPVDNLRELSPMERGMADRVRRMLTARLVTQDAFPTRLDATEWANSDFETVKAQLTFDGKEVPGESPKLLFISQVSLNNLFTF